MLTAIERHLDQAKTEAPMGYAIAIVGTVRSAWVTKTGDFTSYEESDAHLLPDQAAAQQYAQAKGINERFQCFVRVVPTLASVAALRSAGQGLPTVSGYSPNREEQQWAQEPAPLNHDQYLWTSSVHYNLDGKQTYLCTQTESTALLLQLADSHRVELSTLDYDAFCSRLTALEATHNRFPIDGKSPNWASAYQFTCNSRQKTLLLRKLLAFGSPITVPIMPKTFDDLCLPLEHELRAEALSIALFET